jgi:hypothetical protein
VPDQVIEYAAVDSEPVHSRYGVAGFTCAVCAAVGILVTMFLFLRPIPGPAGGVVRGVVGVFGALVLLAWLAGIALGVAGLRSRTRIRTFAAAALVTSAVTVMLFALRLLMY